MAHQTTTEIQQRWTYKLSTYKVQGDSDELAYADTMVIDEAGIDFLIDGEYELCASLEGLDPYQIAYDIMPKDGGLELPDDVTPEYFEECVANWVKIYNSDEEKQDEALLSLKMSAQLFLTVLARIGGYEEAK